MTFFIVSSIIKVVLVFTVILTGVALLTWLERRVCAWMQDRMGPNRVGPFGLLQPAADGLKNIVKEETYPATADYWTFILAPAISFIPALLTFAVIPFGTPHPASASDGFDALAAATEGFAGLTYDRLGLLGRTTSSGAAVTA